MVTELERKEALADHLGVSVDDIKKYEYNNGVFLFKVYSADLDAKVRHEDEVWVVQTYDEARKSMVQFIEDGLLKYGKDFFTLETQGWIIRNAIKDNFVYDSLFNYFQNRDVDWLETFAEKNNIYVGGNRDYVPINNDLFEVTLGAIEAVVYGLDNIDAKGLSGSALKDEQLQLVKNHFDYALEYTLRNWHKSEDMYEKLLELCAKVTSFNEPMNMRYVRDALSILTNNNYAIRAISGYDKGETVYVILPKAMKDEILKSIRSAYFGLSKEEILNSISVKSPKDLHIVSLIFDDYENSLDLDNIAEHAIEFSGFIPIVPAKYSRYLAETNDFVIYRVE